MVQGDYKRSKTQKLYMSHACKIRHVVKAKNPARILEILKELHFNCCIECGNTANSYTHLNKDITDFRIKNLGFLCDNHLQMAKSDKEFAKSIMEKLTLNTRVEKNITIRKDHADYIEKKGLNLSRFVQEKLDSRMTNKPLKHVYDIRRKE